MNTKKFFRSRRAVPLVLFLTSGLLLAGGVTLATSASGPIVVSPGSVREAMPIGESCPTFSWAAVEGAAGYELVVWRLSEGKEENAEFEAVIGEMLPGGALSWTPSLGRCLERGGYYAWAVRVVGGEDAAIWSDPALFTVAAGPTEAEFQEALAIVRRYLEVTRAAAAPGPAPAVSPSDSMEAMTELDVEEPAIVPESAPAKLLATPGTIGIASDVPATTGVTFGLRGITNSISGGSAGVVGQSTAASGNVAGVVGQVASASGAAGEFDNTAGGDILRGLNNGAEVFTVDGSGAVMLTGTVEMGGFKMSTGAAAGRLLTADANGVGSWQTAPGGSDSDWTISGSDMYSAVSGNVGIGTTSPSEKLDVDGNIRTGNQFIVEDTNLRILRDGNGNLRLEADSGKDLELYGDDDALLAADDQIFLEADNGIFLDPGGTFDYHCCPR